MPLFSVLASLGAALAPSASVAETLEIRNFVGSINWSNGPLSVDVKGKIGDLTVTDGSGTIIDGNINKIDRNACESSYGLFSFDWFGKKKDRRFGGYDSLKDYPVLNITLPADTDLVIRNSIIFADGAPDVSKADIELPHCGLLNLGDVKNTLILEKRGSADVTVRDTGQIEANLRGSGDFYGAQSGAVFLKSKGSGDVVLGSIRSLEMNVQGSADVEISDIEGDVEISSHGSGDIDLGSIGSLTMNVHGSAAVETSDIAGDVEISSHGSGDVVIGSIGSLAMNVHGSADVEISDIAGDAEILSHGSGDMELGNIEGTFIFSGHGSGDLDVRSVAGGRLSLQSNSSGDIDIDGGDVDTLMIGVGGSAKVDYAGTAGTATLWTSGSGDIYVDQVRGAAETKTSGSGEIDIDKRG